MYDSREPSSVCGCMWVNGRPVSNRFRAWTFLIVESGPGIRSSPLDSPLSVGLDIDIVGGTELYTVFQKQIIFCDAQIHRAGSGRVQKYIAFRFPNTRRQVWVEVNKRRTHVNDVHRKLVRVMCGWYDVHAER